ncbi:hypothetical protein [Clostridium intestinale]|uniref:Uncharacterized protein n=1 Tax=Clostridium intestinale URNW TaxID=1294142 RepID=U2NSL3_9CLOT|nr:hypothetical protein [Clostridium intestinale]ERK31861.1 hypothetical protein CINTURNW_1051 [Clostridium intestinale URNW]
MNEENMLKLKKLLSDISRVENYKELVNDIIDLNVKVNSDDLVDGITNSLSEAFNTDFYIMMVYFQGGNKFTPKNFGDLSNPCKEVLEFINTLMVKYGYILRKLMIEKRNPFLLNLVETNIENGSLLHSIKFKRVDGEELSGNIDIRNLLSISTVLIQTADIALKSAVYNLNIDIIENFLKTSKSINSQLENIISNIKR